MERNSRAGIVRGDVRSYSLSQNRLQSRSRSPLLPIRKDYQHGKERSRNKSRSPSSSTDMHRQRYVIPTTSNYIWNPERRDESPFTAHSCVSNVHQPVSLNYNHGTTLTIDYAHQGNTLHNTGEVSDRLRIDYDHRRSREMDTEIRHRLGGRYTDMSRTDRLLRRSDDNSYASTSTMSSIQQTAAEILRIEEMTRYDQINIYKDSKEYKMFDENFPKHNKRFTRPITPDRPDIPSSSWMQMYSQWKKEIRDTLDKNNLKSKLVEDDEETLMRRQKNIDYCKTTEAYARYVALVPKSSRAKTDPRTPDKFKIYSRRCWDGGIKSWKLRIHRRLEELDGISKAKS